MSLSRRKVLTIIGGGTILAATAASAAFVATRTPARAIAPWAMAGGHDDIRKAALSYAVLAPNPHNRQPWLVDLGTADTVVLYRDKSRDLPETDPFARQLTIGLGCFLELMSIAASAGDHSVDLDLFPEGEQGPVAFARFRRGAEPDRLFAHVLSRRSCKEPFEDRPIAPELIARLEAFGDIVTEEGRVDALRRLTEQAWMVETFTPRTLRESVELMRFGKAEINANPDGIPVRGGFLEILMLAGLLTRDSQLQPDSLIFQEGVQRYRGMLAATPAYAVLTTPGNTRKDQIEAGRRWLRLNLTTTALGLSLHPVSQALQEYPEMSEHYAAAPKMLAIEGHTVQMLGRLGYGPTVPPSPRWPLETRIVHG